MPLPCKFLSGRTSFKHLLFANYSRSTRRRFALNKSLKSLDGWLGSAVFPGLECNFALFGQTISPLYTLSGAFRQEQAVLDTQLVDPMRESNEAFFKNKSIIQNKFSNVSTRAHQLADASHETIVSFSSCPNSADENDAQTYAQSLEISQSLNPEQRQKINESIDSGLFPLTLVAHRSEQTIQRYAFYALEVALGISNRRIDDGLSAHPSLKPLAIMADRRLKNQKNKPQFKFSKGSMKLEDHPLFLAVEVLAAKLYIVAREISRIRARRCLESHSLQLCADKIDERYLHYLTCFVPPIQPPFRKPGSNMAWFERVKYKNHVEDVKSQVLWLHAEKKEGRTKVRYYGSRKAWERNNAYWFDQQSGQLVRSNLELEREKRAAATSASGNAFEAVRNLYHEQEKRAASAPVSSNGSEIGVHLPYKQENPNPSKGPQITRDLFNNQERLSPDSGSSSGLRIRRHGSYGSGKLEVIAPAFNNGPQIIYNRRYEPESPIVKAPAISNGPRIRRHPTYDPQSKGPLSHRPLLTRRDLHTYARMDYHVELTKRAQIKRPGSISLRQRLVDEERDKKMAVVAILQGKVLASAHNELKPEPMDEDDFVEALTNLTRVTVEDITESTGMEFMEPGDMVELRGVQGGSELGVFVQPPLALNGEFLFLTETGKVKPWPTGCLPFVVSDYLSKRSVELLRDYLRQMEDEEMISNPPRHLTKPLVDPIREFHKKALDVFAKKLPVLEKLYQMFSHETETKVITTLEATAAVFPEGFENHHVYAVHMALMGDSKHFAADAAKQHRKSGQFEVRSRRDVKILEDVTAWVRNKAGKQAAARKGQLFSDQLLSFVTKARGLIDTHRALRADEKQLFTPVKPVPQPKYEWDENDKAIIQFLKYSTNRTWFQDSPYQAIIPSILRAVDRYNKEPKYDFELAYHFLTEIGVYKPWENPFRYSNRHPLPYHRLSRRVDSVQDKMEEMNRDIQSAWEKLQLKDIMEPYRTEWESQTIYAIDDASAEEIDDGISIEPISDSETWCHVHIANPTAFIPPDHWLAEAARERMQTVYLPDQTYPMLPKSLSEFIFGLGSGHPVLSISGRIDNATGELLEHKITPGISRVVKRITYQEFNTVIGIENKKPMRIIVNADPEVGDLKKSGAAISSDESVILKKMRQLAVAIKKKRARDGAMSFILPSFRLKVDHGGQPQAPAEDIPVLYTGLPSIKFERFDAPTEAHETVAEFMLFAGTTVAKFLRDRGVPAPFRNNTISAREGSESVFRNVILPARNEFGLVPREIMKQNLGVMGASRLQSEATTGHIVLGAHYGYLKATSPLRRYIDMVVHWQVQRVLLNEYNGRPANENLPFSKEYLDKSLPRMEVKERQLNQLQSESEKFWVWRMLQWGRLEGQVKKIPNKLPKLVVELSSKNEWPLPCVGLLTEFAVPMKVLFNNKEDWEKVQGGQVGLVEFDDKTPNKIRLNMRWVGGN